MGFEDLTGLANRLNEFFTSVGSLTTIKASELTSQNEFNSNFEVLPPALVSSTAVKNYPKLGRPRKVMYKMWSEYYRLTRLQEWTKYLLEYKKTCSLPFTLATITHIVNTSFTTNTFARAWKMAEITPILKCRNPEVPSVLCFQGVRPGMTRGVVKL